MQENFRMALFLVCWHSERLGLQHHTNLNESIHSTCSSVAVLLSSHEPELRHTLHGSTVQLMCAVLCCTGDADEDALCGLGLDFNLGMDAFDLGLAEPDVNKAPEKAPTKSGKRMLVEALTMHG